MTLRGTCCHLFSPAMVALLALAFAGCGPAGEQNEAGAAAQGERVNGADQFPASSLEEQFMRVFHVAPHGRDEAAGTAAAPFATLERAREAVRQIERPWLGDVLVAVAPGDYYLEEPFELGTADSGRDGFVVRYRGMGEPGSARLLGGRRIDAWEAAGGGVYVADVGSEEAFHTLYENGIRARKARYPDYEYNARFPLSGARYLNARDGTDTVLAWREGDLNAIDVTDLGERANLVFWPWSYAAWHKVTRRIERIDTDKRTIHVPENEGRVAIGAYARYYIEGARQLLDQPGEFYLDEAAGKLYYWPRFPDNGERVIIVPRLKRVISVEGNTADDPVRAIAIEGFELGYTDTFAAMTGRTLFPWSVSTGYGAHGTLHLRYTEDVAVRFNHVRASGLSGIYLERSNKRNTVYGNWVEDSGISGIVLAYHRERRDFPRDINEFNRVESNLIHGMGQIAVDSAGVNVWGVANNTVAHNEIFDGARYGITVRGPFTQRDFGDTNRHLARGNLFRHNHLYRLGQDSGDMGAFHMAAISSPEQRPVNTFQQNLIEDIAAHPSMNDVKPNGIFLDYPEGVTDQIFRDIEIRSTEVPFRSNNTDIRHVYENVSWRDGFNPAFMEYQAIGLKADFPASFRAPGEVTNVRVGPGSQAGHLKVSWSAPEDADLAGVRLTLEGEADAAAVFAEAGETMAEMPRPDGGRIAHYRLRAVDRHGNASQGVLVRSGLKPGEVSGIEATGIEGGILLAWEEPADAVEGYRITLDDPTVEPVEVEPGASRVKLEGLENHRIYTVRVDVRDQYGLAWPGQSFKAAAGEGMALPQDAAAWWTFDVPAVRAGLSIGDASGNGNTLFVANEAVEVVDGRLGALAARCASTASPPSRGCWRRSPWPSARAIMQYPSGCASRARET